MEVEAQIEKQIVIGVDSSYSDFYDLSQRLCEVAFESF
jgi:hypothetical protein